MTYRRPQVVHAALTNEDRAVLIAVRDLHLIDAVPLANATDLSALEVTQVIKAMKERFRVGTIALASAAAQEQGLLA